MHPPGGGLSFLPNFQKERGSQFLEGVAGKEGVTFFRGFCSLYVKNKLKSEIFNDKKALINKNGFLCHN